MRIYYGNHYKCYNVNAEIFSYRVSFLWYTHLDVFGRSEVKPSVSPVIMSLFAFRKINVKFLRKLTEHTF